MAEKAKVIVSDLHLGAGFAPDNALEDFVVDDQFATFLRDLVAESDEKSMDLELIINGDWIEFLQVPALDTFDPASVYPPEDYHPSSEEASAKKMALVIAGHPTFFEALRDFLNPGPPRRNVTVLKGNHDVNLHWTGVQECIREAMEATGERWSLLAFEERRVTREGVYVEHGNQYLQKINRFDDFEEPHDPDDVGELEIPAGSKFVIEFFNDVECQRWWVDAVKPITSLIWYSFAVDFAFAARAVVNFLRVAPVLIVGSFAVEGEPGIEPRPEDLAHRLGDEREIAALARRYAAEEPFRREFNARLDWLLRAADAPVGVAAQAALKEGDAVARARDIEESTDIALQEVAQAKIMEEHASVVVFGHTHRALCRKLEGGVYLNSGTWVWWRDFAGMDLKAWKEFYAHPEQFTRPHYLTYVRVDYDQEGRPHGQVLDYAGQLVVECTRPDQREGCGAWWARLVSLLKGGGVG